MLIILGHPEVANRNCGQCMKYVYDEKTGARVVERECYVLRNGQPPPCETSQGCAKGSPTAGKVLSDKNHHAYAHYQECRAVNSFPNDSIVRQNAALFRRIQDEHESMERKRASMLLEAYLGVK